MVGEHIRALKGGRWMHAIDCGDETVLHLVEDAVPRRVRRAYRPEFVGGATAVELVTHRERTFPAAEIVRRAYSRASDPTLAAMFADSEAFAEWCTTGRLSGARNSAVEVPGVPPAPGAAPAQGRRAGEEADPLREAEDQGEGPAGCPRRPAAAGEGEDVRARGEAGPGERPAWTPEGEGLPRAREGEALRRAREADAQGPPLSELDLRRMPSGARATKRPAA